MRWLWALLLVPLASGQASIDNPDDPTPVTLWMHCVSLGDCPINTQEPDPTFSSNVDLGLAQFSQGCVDVPAVGVFSRTTHTIYGYSSPYYVQYEHDEGGHPRYHPDRGLASDVLLDLATTPLMTWFVEVETRGAELPAVAPRTRVDVTLRGGDEISVDHEAFNTGPLIAHGSSGPIDLHPLQSDAPAVRTGLYRFDVPLRFGDEERIAKEEAFNIRVDVITDIPGCNRPAENAYATLPTVASHAGGEWWPRLQLSIMNPITIQTIMPRIVEDGVLIHVEAVSPWGFYDLAGDRFGEEDTLTMAITGPTEPRLVERIAPHTSSSGHGWLSKPLQAHWFWEAAQDDWAPGTYTATFRVENDQRSANATATASFDLGTGSVSGCLPEAGHHRCVQGQVHTEETTPTPMALALLALVATCWVRAHKD